MGAQEQTGPRPATASPRAGRSVWVWLVIAVVSAGSAVLLFARLGHYALWDDEALTALHGLGVWETGDTTAVVGRNVVGFRGGVLLRGLYERHTPPLSSYLAAAPVGLWRTAWAARLPFALCGLGCVGLLLRWAWRDRADLLTWALLGMAILGNVSFFLYFRQCRYYGPAILLSVALAYLYLHWDGRRRAVLGFSLLSAALFATNYMSYGALYVCLAVDYLGWGVRRRPLSRSDWWWLLIPQLLIGAPLASVWNPSDKPSVEYHPESWLAEKATLYWWMWRDLCRCEFGVAVLFVAALVLCAQGRGGWLSRAVVALAVYVAAITAVSPQPVGLTVVGDVRYVAPVIPLCMAVGVLTLRTIGLKAPWATLVLGAVVFGTSLVPGGRPWRGDRWSTPGEYVRELIDPPDDPFTAAAGWVNAHVPEGKSVWVVPENMAIPLMFHAPKAVYAWQFADPPPAQFRGLAPIHYWGRVAPDYVIAFGPALATLDRFWTTDKGLGYRRVATLDVFGQPVYRPELMLRIFRPIKPGVLNKATEAVYVFARDPAAGPG